MRLRGDDRAVTVQVGAVLLLGILVISLSIFQTTVVPNENEQVEFQHNQVVQEDMQSFRSAVTRAGGVGLTQSVAVRLGTQYPERALFINPPPPTGTLQTGTNSDVEIQNARALDDETSDYWDGASQGFTTTSVRYSPSYNVYQNAPTTVYEGSVLYNEFDGGTTIAQSQQSVVDGRTISLVAIDGELSRSQLGAVAVDVRPKSVSQRTVTVEGDGDPVTVLVPTSLDASVWQNTLLADEYDDPSTPDDPDKYVAEVNPTGGNAVEIVFEPGYQYNLNLAKVGVGTGVDEPEPAYATTVSGDEQVVPEGTTRQFVVEVRDQFNNPLSGVELNSPTITNSAQAGNDSVAFAGASETNSDGQVVVEYTAPDDVDGEQTAEVEVGFGSIDEEKVTVSLRVEDSNDSGSGGNGGSNINPGDPGSVTQKGAVIADTNQVLVTLENTGDERRIIDEVRLNFYYEDSQGQAGTSPPTTAEFNNGEATLNIRGAFKDVFEIVEGDNENSLSLRFFTDQNRNGEYDVQEGDFFVFTVLYDNDDAATYFVAPTDTDEPINADFSYSPSSPASSETISFDATSTTDDDTDSRSYSWEFGDGTTATGAQPSHTYSSAGTYAVNLTVEDSGGEFDTYSRLIEVTAGGGGGGGGNTGPTANAGPNTGVDEGQTVELDGTGSSDPDGSISSYSWTITDDNGASVSLRDANTATPVFDASSANVGSDTPVTVELTVEDNDGATSSDTVQVTVRDTGGSNSPQTLYPDQFDDQNGGDAAIPPNNPQGIMSAFSQMQTDNNQYAQLQPGGSQNKEMSIGVATNGVDTSATTYELEVRHGYENGAKAATLQIVDSSGTVLQSQSLTPTGSTATTSISLNTQATNSVQNNGQLYVVYTKSNDNKNLYVYYQRLVAS
ncbi:PKD domain-containing protein [Halogranum gelatinilyticum]|uniref:PKD domain-containing protein n=1 Tax=Halogranum gelatinilyticum TaxID=660521 RepID=A0A1G9TPZ2_9EURY|nr:PKD domain-containing protein [Halogranum gelatinilyticum]SDM49185.1 PKD domain-containing protein [Halogranum gelatinilyticum]